MELSPDQATQVQKQLANHNHDDYCTDIKLAPNHIIRDFRIHRGVFRPDITCALYLARWLFWNNGEYLDKRVIDIGCGTGLQGLVTGLFGARSVISSDISSLAVKNTRDNVKQYGLTGKINVDRGNLFEKVTEPVNVIIFNHPFFPEEPYQEQPISKSMLGGEDLFHQFLEESKRYLLPQGFLVTSYFHLAGETNNPAIQGPKHNYSVTETFRIDVGTGLQQGLFSIYKLKQVELC